MRRCSTSASRSWSRRCAQAGDRRARSGHDGGMRAPLCLALLTLCASCASRPPQAAGPRADLLLTHARFVTLDPARPEARALAIRDGRVLAAGSEEELAALVDAHTQVLDLGGALAVPGLIDSHAHLWGIGALKLELDLRDAAS